MNLLWLLRAVPGSGGYANVQDGPSLILLLTSVIGGDQDKNANANSLSEAHDDNYWPDGLIILGHHSGWTRVRDSDRAQFYWRNCVKMESGEKCDGINYLIVGLVRGKQILPSCPGLLPSSTPA